MAEDPIHKELDALKADIAQLRKDIAGLTAAVRDVASEKVADTKADAQQRVQGAWADVERKLDEVLNQGRATVGDIEDKINILRSSSNTSFFLSASTVNDSYMLWSSSSFTV